MSKYYAEPAVANAAAAFWREGLNDIYQLKSTYD
jgi:hypothetical protein